MKGSGGDRDFVVLRLKLGLTSWADTCTVCETKMTMGCRMRKPQAADGGIGGDKTTQVVNILCHICPSDSIDQTPFLAALRTRGYYVTGTALCTASRIVSSRRVSNTFFRTVSRTVTLRVGNHYSTSREIKSRPIKRNHNSPQHSTIAVSILSSLLYHEKCVRILEVKRGKPVPWIACISRRFN